MPSSTVRCILSLALAVLSTSACRAQAIPSTPGETLSGKPIVLADAVHGQTALLVAGFSREGGDHVGEWIKVIHADPAFSHIAVFSIAMLAGAPSLFRGMIKSSMKKGITPAEQVRFVVLTSDEQPWKSFFGVTTDSDPYVVLIDPQGRMVWHGHGPAAQLKQKLKETLQ